MSKTIAIFMPPDSLGMSTLLIKNLLWIAAQHAHHQAPDVPVSNVVCASLDGAPVNEFSGGKLPSDCSLDQLDDIDAVFLSAFWSNASQTLEQCSPLLASLKQWHQKSVPIIA